MVELTLVTPHEAGWDLNEVKCSSWGLPPPTRAQLWWGARTINSRGEVLGIVHDRQTGICSEGGLVDLRRSAFEAAVLQRILPDLRNMAQRIRDNKPYCREWQIDSVGLVRGVVRLSGGYGHLCVWLEPDATVTT